MVIARPGGHAIPLVTPRVSAVVEAGRQEARRALAHGGRLDPPLLLLLDEVCKVCPLPQLPELVTDCASQGIVVVYALQSLEDGRTAWGPTRFGGMWSATNCHLVMGQVSSAENAPRPLRPLPDSAGRGPPRGAQRPRRAPGPGGPLRARPHHRRALGSPGALRHRLLRAPADAARHAHVASPQSEVQAQALASKAAWLRWVTEHQSPQAMGRRGDEED